MHQPGTATPPPSTSTRATAIADGEEWRWLYRQIRPYILYEIASLALVLCASAVQLTSPLLMKWLIDRILPQREWRNLILVTFGFFAVQISGNALRSCGG